MLMEHRSLVDQAWALYFGLIFIAFVLFAPRDLGLATTAAATRRTLTWRCSSLTA
jgi:hypothetical protein